MRRIATIVISALALSLAGCHSVRRHADLVFVNAAEPETLDPQLLTGQPEMRIATAVFEGLLRRNATGHVEPGIAESWEISPDKLTYTFHLRANAYWSDGRPLTAHDFVGSWERALRPSTAAQYAYQLYPIKNAQAYNEGKITDFSKVGVSAPNDRTLIVHLANSTPYFLDLCAFSTLFPVPLTVIAKWGDNWIKPQHIVSDGAYLLTEWRLNDVIRLTKNPRYWDAAHVAMRTIDALPIANANTAFNYYETGEVDLLLDKGLVPIELIDVLRKRADFHSAPFLGTYFIRFNVKRPPFNDPRVRKAIALVINKKLLVEKITRAGEKPASSLVPPGCGDDYQSPPGLQRNDEEARKLLAAAGYPGGKGFPLISYLYNGAADSDRLIAIEIQKMLHDQLGITMELRGQEWKVYLNSLETLDFDFARSSWVGDYDDPNTFLNMFVTNGGNNETGWSNATYDQLIAAAAKEPDPQKRNAIFRNAEKMLVSDDAVVCPLYYYSGIEFYNGKKLGGIESNLLDEHPLRTMFWKKKP